MGAVNEGDAGPVDAYLDDMFDRLAGTGAAGRRMLTETEDHLRSASADARARGLDPTAAEREAVARFGPPEVTQRAGARATGPLTTAATVLGVSLAGYGIAGFLGAFTRALSSRYVADCTTPLSGDNRDCAVYVSGFNSIGVLLGLVTVTLTALALGLTVLGLVTIVQFLSRRNGGAFAHRRTVARPLTVVFAVLTALFLSIAANDGVAGLWSLVVHHAVTGVILLAFALVAFRAAVRLPSSATRHS
ncbi:hypothetical protein [Dactylosporangium sp. CA-233914]|uniref:hypothetical protein n=1 Tax=Dactylosporangium sp. CA-233914 TaxID=3239934 RepID=UPI003D8BC65A